MRAAWRRGSQPAPRGFTLDAHGQQQGAQRPCRAPGGRGWPPSGVRRWRRRPGHGRHGCRPRIRFSLPQCRKRACPAFASSAFAAAPLPAPACPPAAARLAVEQAGLEFSRRRGSSTVSRAAIGQLTDCAVALPRSTWRRSGRCPCLISDRRHAQAHRTPRLTVKGLAAFLGAQVLDVEPRAAPGSRAGCWR